MKCIVFLSFFLVSCTSAPLSVNHYLLHTPTPVVTEAHNKQKTPIYFSSVTLADYLRQASLIIQLNEHELHYSRQDLWAEGLQSSFYKALKHDLNFYNPLQNITEPNSVENALTLKVNLQHFLITNRASVISSGTYSIKSKGANWLQKPFYFTIPLEKDGYPHAVSQLRKTIESLALQINQDIRNIQSSNN
ncbi:MAG: ABC-type transport auxiliary lipoprotein family protein [Paraglaciecola sp.]|uniref:PqiC family protein n=1 Tax=Paraglaciecola sp. TaxID=1920173 RepID=UPI0032667B8E